MALSEAYLKDKIIEKENRIKKLETMLRKIENINNAAFGLKGFQIEKLKKEIEASLK